METEGREVCQLRMSESEEMRRLRWLLAMVYAGPRLYIDDGEYSDPESGIDFRRDSVHEIELKMLAYAERKQVAVMLKTIKEPKRNVTPSRMYGRMYGRCELWSNTMRLFLDCEYNEFRGELISMALVAEDGREWYEVVPCEKPGAWVAQNVMPLLGKPPLPCTGALSASLAHFLEQFDSAHIVADWPEDIAHFCTALIIGPGKRIDTPPLTMEVLRIDAPSALPHNALADARGIRDAVLAA